MPISLKARASKRRLIIRGLCVWVTKKKGASRGWPAETSAHEAWRLFLRILLLPLTLRFSFPSEKSPTPVFLDHLPSLLTHLSSALDGRVREEGGKEWGCSWPGGCLGVLPTTIPLGGSAAFLFGKDATWGDDEKDGWMRSVNKQQLVGCWLSYCAAVSWIRNVAFCGIFLGMTIKNFQQRIGNYAICITINMLKINVPLFNNKNMI